MDLRVRPVLRDLADIDPLGVPLPNGTEVITRVDRVLGERRVPQGAVGRVVASEGMPWTCWWSASGWRGTSAPSWSPAGRGRRATRSGATPRGRR